MLKRILVASLIVVFAFGSLGLRVASAEDTVDCGDYYTVQAGDTLSSIAVKCNVPIEKLVIYNPMIEDINLIYTGQIINLTEKAAPVIPDTGDSSDETVLYTVKAGDTLSGIATFYHLSLVELLAANPSIDSKNLIYTGQVLTIPLGSKYSPSVSVSPAVASQNGSVNLLATGFPPNDVLEISIGRVESEATALNLATTDNYGRVSIIIPVPNWVKLGEDYVFAVYERDNQSFRTISNIVTFVENGTSAPTPGAEQYIVQSGDTLSEIARQFDTSVATLLLLNPEITNPQVIYRGQVIQLPKETTTSEPWISVSDLTPIAGQELSVKASHFPANVNVDIRLFKRGEQTFEAVADARSNDEGEISGSIRIPDSAIAGELWEVKVVTTELENNVEITSPALTIVQ